MLRLVVTHPTSFCRHRGPDDCIYFSLFFIIFSYELELYIKTISASKYEHDYDISIVALLLAELANSLFYLASPNSFAR